MQQSFSAIDTPYTQATSEQRRQMKAHSDCRARIASAAKPTDVVLILVDPPAPQPQPPAPSSPLKDWVERQKKIPLPASPAPPQPVTAIRSADRNVFFIRDIQIAVANFYNIELKDMLSASQKRPVVWIRQIGMYLASELTDWSSLKIGRAFGGRDHTTVLFAIRKIANLIRSDAALAHDVADLELLLSEII